MADSMIFEFAFNLKAMVVVVVDYGENTTNRVLVYKLRVL